MNSFLSTLLGWVGLAPPRIFCRRKVWEAGVRELASRTLGEKQESGAYLLGKTLTNGTHDILDFVFYDDVDPQALATGIVTIRETALPRLWEICRARGYGTGWTIHCWWDRWLAGARAAGRQSTGDNGLALAGVFAAAVAMRQIFACALAARSLRPRDVTVNLWEPWNAAETWATGPATFDVPDKLWFLGLGHLGQGFVWSLCLLGAHGGRAVAQDDQTVGEENEATSLLVLPTDLGAKKARVAARWLESCRWKTDIIERRHHGDIPVTQEDPPYLLCGLDRLQPRLALARHGFEFMLDAGLGHGAHDFEGIQIRTISKGQSIEGLWDETVRVQDEAPSAKLMEKKPYTELETRIGRCGIVSFAEASTAVPFVGAATGALVIAQAIRLASLQPTTRFLQMELGAPEMVSQAGLAPRPTINLGSIPMDL